MSGVQRRRPKVLIAREAGDLYSSLEQQRVMDHRSRLNTFEMRAAEMKNIAREKGNFYSSPQKQLIQDHRFDTSAAEKTKTAAQTSRRLSIDSICCIYMHSDHSGATIETYSSGGGGVCSEDSRTEWDSTASCCTSRITAISIQQQMEELHPTVVCPYFLDPADKLINLPDDLIGNVLRGLSVKEIMRMGCLNRSWRSELQRINNDEGHNLSQYRSIHHDAAVEKVTPTTCFSSSLKGFVL